MLKQHFISLGHIEKQVGLHVANVAYGFTDQSGQRLAIVDIERTAVAKHHIEVVIGAENVAPGEPVEDTRRLLLKKRHVLRNHLLVGTHHALCVDHHLRGAGGAGCQ